MVLNNVANVSITGLTIDYSTQNFSQGTIIAIASDHLSMDVEVDPGYPTYLDNTSYFPAQPVMYIYDPETLQIKVGSSDVYTTGITRIGATTFR